MVAVGSEIEHYNHMQHKRGNMMICKVEPNQE